MEKAFYCSTTLVRPTLIHVMLISCACIPAFAAHVHEKNTMWIKSSEKRRKLDAGMPTCPFRLPRFHEYDIFWRCFWKMPCVLMFYFYCTYILQIVLCINIPASSIFFSIILWFIWNGNVYFLRFIPVGTHYS